VDFDTTDFDPVDVVLSLEPLVFDTTCSPDDVFESELLAYANPRFDPNEVLVESELVTFNPPSFVPLDVALELLVLDNSEFDPDDVGDGFEELDKEPDPDAFNELELNFEDELVVESFF
jgi:hypothetical protein